MSTAHGCVWPVVTKDDPFRRVWDMLLSLMLIYTGTVFPYRLCFLEYRIPDGSPPDEVWEQIETVVDGFFIVDLFLRFFFSYRDARHREIVEWRHIVSHYLRFWFWLNFVASLPPSFVAWLLQVVIDVGISGSSVNRSLRLSRMFRLLKLLRVARLFKIFLALGQQRDNVVLGKSLRFVNFIVSMLWSVHLTACGVYLVASLHEEPKNTWVFRRMVGEGSLLNEGPLLQWLHAMYFVVTVFTTVGFGDNFASTVGEVLYLMVAMFCGTLIHIFIIGSLLELLQEEDAEESEIRARRDVVAAFACHTKLNSAVALRLGAWASRPRHSRFDRDETLRILTTGLSQEMISTMPPELFRGRLVKNRLLRRFPGISPQIPMKVAILMKHHHSTANEIIYHTGDSPNAIFLVLEGTYAHVILQPSELVAPTDGEQLVPYRLFGRESYFGDSDIVACRARRATVRCEREGELLSLPKVHLWQLMDDHPEFARAWRREASRREGFRRSMLKRSHGAAADFRTLAALSIQRMFRHGLRRETICGSSFSHFARPREAAEQVRCPDVREQLREVQRGLEDVREMLVACHVSCAGEGEAEEATI